MLTFAVMCEIHSYPIKRLALSDMEERFVSHSAETHWKPSIRFERLDQPLYSYIRGPNKGTPLHLDHRYFCLFYLFCWPGFSHGWLFLAETIITKSSQVRLEKSFNSPIVLFPIMLFEILYLFPNWRIQEQRDKPEERMREIEGHPRGGQSSMIVYTCSTKHFQNNP